MLPIKTGTDGALVVPLTTRWNAARAAAPEQTKKQLPDYNPNFGEVTQVKLYPSMNIRPMGNPTSDRPTVINPLDFMKGNPFSNV